MYKILRYLRDIVNEPVRVLTGAKCRKTVLSQTHLKIIMPKKNITDTGLCRLISEPLLYYKKLISCLCG